MPFLQKKPKTYNLKDELPFGKHKGEILEDVIDDDPEYVDWMVENISSFDLSVDALDYLRNTPRELECFLDEGWS
jgi:hypothetical protein